MANIKSQKKRIITAEKARVRNRAVRSELKTAVKAVRTAVELDAEGSLPDAPVPDYADETVSTKVVKIIQSYTGVVDKMVWRKA